jgi:hypothetical protein
MGEFVYAWMGVAVMIFWFIVGILFGLVSITF